VEPSSSSTPETGADGGVTPDKRADTHDARDSGPPPLPYMIGIKTDGVPTGPAKVETWLGRPLDVAGTTINTTGYIGSGTRYTTVSGAHPLLEDEEPAARAVLVGQLERRRARGRHRDRGCQPG
jgi:hypothetical protein